MKLKLKIPIKPPANFIRNLVETVGELIQLFQKPVPAAIGFAVVLILFIFVWRWSDWSLRQARFLESHQKYGLAVRSFQRFASKHPKDPRAPEALVSAARIYAKIFSRCEEAKPLYERAAREYEGAQPWAELAKQGLLECPDYFPLKEGMKWTYVDSESGGKNMRLELELQTQAAEGAPGGEVGGAYYAGKTRFRNYKRKYSKEDWAIWEIEGKSRTNILKYPFEPGQYWWAKREGKKVLFNVESNRETTVVRAGKFYNCLKVREVQPGAKAWKYDYYAPGVGRIKTTIGGPGFEKPNTELKKIVFANTSN